MNINPSARARPEARIRAFVVEDNPLILERLVEMLEEETQVRVVGTSVDEAGAVAWLASSEPATVQLIIIDIFLLRGTGLGVLEALGGRLGHIKRVMLTNYATSAVRARCMQLGADRVFDKSTEVDELLAYCAELEP